MVAATTSGGHSRPRSFTWMDDYRSSESPSKPHTSSPRTPTAISAVPSPCSSAPKSPISPGEEQLQPGQIYFLLPLSKSQEPLTLQDLCSLAIKASSALPKLTSQPPFKYRPAAVTTPPSGFCEVPIGFQAPARRG
ncbi:hypothetical protein Patl1_36309 [Pistacia atlantica]|nr:hypothetical protein Patl1_36309 [Pistacia atlantica]